MSFCDRFRMMPRLLSGVALAGILALTVGASLAQDQAVDQKMSASELQKAIESRRLELDTNKLKQKSIEADVKSIEAEREKLNQRLLDAAAQIQKSEGQLTAIEARLGELEAQRKLVQGSLSERNAEIGDLLAALQRMGRNPPPVMITKREDALEMVRSAMLLSTAFPQLKDQAVALVTKLDDLDRVMTDIRTEGDKLKAETERLAEMRTKLSSLMAAKKQSITDRQAELADVRKAASDISQNVSDLGDLITKLDQTVSEKTGLGRYQAETKLAAATPPPASAPAAPAAVPEAAALPPSLPAPQGAEKPPGPGPEDAAKTAPGAPKSADLKVVELAPTGNALTAGNPGRIKPAIAFASAKGLLPLPAQGRRALAYGEKTRFGNTSKGIVIETRANAQVTSPCDGWIVYAGEFRSYGQLLIINAGGGYHILLAGLSQIDVEPGQFVLAAEPVGTMGGLPGPASAGSEDSGPVLYIEFRKDGETVDPDPWWVGQQKAQG